jgi:hypothetical protein
MEQNDEAQARMASEYAEWLNDMESQIEYAMWLAEHERDERLIKQWEENERAKPF